MGAAWYCARADLRRRWTATVLLVLLVGIVAGGVLATLAGARRSSSAYERFREVALAADMDVAPSSNDPAAEAALTALPEVEVAVPLAAPFIVPQGSGMYPFIDFLAIVGKDDRMGRVIDRSRVIDGRTPAPDAADECFVTELFAGEAHLRVGDRVTFESYSPDQVEPLFTTGDAGPPRGPAVTLTVVGISRHPDDLSESLSAFSPRVGVSPAFYSAYSGKIGVYEAGFRVRTNGADPAAVEDAVRTLFADDPELEVAQVSEITERVEDSIGVLVTALLLGAAVAAVAGLVAIGQALARHLGDSRAEHSVIAALGMERRQRLAALLLTVAPVVVAGAVLGVVVAVAASPLFPVGLARRAEPELGLSVDGAALGVGLVAVIVMVGGVALAAAWGASRPRAAGRSDRRSPSPVFGAVRRLGLRPAPATGVRFALETGRGQTAVPVRSALVGAALGIAGVVAVGVFAASLAQLVDSPQRYGFPWSARVAGFQSDLAAQLKEQLARDGDVAYVGTVSRNISRLRVGGDVNAFAFESVKGSDQPTLLEGRLPVSDDEVVLGSSTMSRGDGGIGDRVSFVTPAGEVPLRVVGRAAFPIVDDRSGVGRGAIVTRKTLDRVVDPSGIDTDLLVTWAPGVDADAANAALEERTGSQVFAPRFPSEVNNLEVVKALPWALAVFLTILGGLALAHALTATVRRKQYDFAVLRALGFRRDDVSVTVVSQATAFTLVGIAVGVPVGVIVGRVTWQSVADGIGVVDDPATPLLLLLAFAAGALVLANVVAAVPARVARRADVVVSLRAD